MQAGQGKRGAKSAEGDAAAGDGLQTLAGEKEAQAWEALQRHAQRHQQEKHTRERRAAVGQYEAAREERRERAGQRQEFLQLHKELHGRQATVLPPSLREKPAAAAPRRMLLLGVTSKAASGAGKLRK